MPGNFYDFSLKIMQFQASLSLKYRFKTYSTIVENNKNIGWTENFCLTMMMKHIMLRAIYNAEIVCSVDKFPP